MLHACVQRFDVMGNLENLAKFSGTKLDPRLLGGGTLIRIARRWCHQRRIASCPALIRRSAWGQRRR